MSNFSDFIKENSANKSNGNFNSDKSKYSEEQLEELINKYSGLSEDKLMSEFLRLTLEKKKRGQLTDSEMENIKNKIIPFLNNEQKDNLNKIIDMVKNVK